MHYALCHGIEPLLLIQHPSKRLRSTGIKIGDLDDASRLSSGLEVLQGCEEYRLFSNRGHTSMAAHGLPRRPREGTTVDDPEIVSFNKLESSRPP